VTSLGDGYATSEAADRLYAALPSVYRAVDSEHGDAMLRFIAGVVDGTGAGDADADLSRFAAVLQSDIASAPITWVRWLAQHLGVPRSSSQTEAEEREAASNASSGWRSGTETALADAVRQGIRPYSALDTYFVPDPDASTAYVTPVENLLDADTAHAQQSKGGWNGTPATTDDGSLSTSYPARFGDSSVRFTTTGVGVQRAHAVASAAGAGPAVVGSTQYTFSCHVRPEISGERFAVGVVFMDEASSDIGGAPASSAYVTCPAGEWTQVWLTFTTTAGATRVRPFVQRESSDGDGAFFHVDAACLRGGADSSFIPSVRVSGVVDLWARMSGQLDGAIGLIFDAQDGNDGYSLAVDAAGHLQVTLGGTAGTRTLVTAEDLPFGTYEVGLVRAVINPDDDAGDSTVTFLYAEDGPPEDRVWEALGAEVVSVGTGETIPHSGVALVGVGGPSDPKPGSIFEVELRDGEGGPTVLRFDVTDLPVGDPVPFTDSGSGADWAIQIAADTAELARYPESPYVNILQHYLGDPWVLGVVTSVFDSPADTAVITRAIERAGARPAGFRIQFVDFAATWETIEAERPTWDDWEPGTWDEVESTQPS
jgi:hypothetical protein